MIRDEALRLFALHGPDAVSMRQVAAAAEVSPGLIVHHFASKDGLRAAVDRHVLATFERLLAELAANEGDLYDAGASGSLAEAMLAHLPAGSAVPAYLRRLLVEPGEAGRVIFARLYELANATLEGLARAGQVDPGEDPSVRAALLMVTDLGVLLLRDRLAEVLGFDPLTVAGMSRWARQVVAVYSGELRPTGQGAGPGTGSRKEARSR